MGGNGTSGGHSVAGSSGRADNSSDGEAGGAAVDDAGTSSSDDEEHPAAPAIQWVGENAIVTAAWECFANAGSVSRWEQRAAEAASAAAAAAASQQDEHYTCCHAVPKRLHPVSFDDGEEVLVPEWFTGALNEAQVRCCRERLALPALKFIALARRSRPALASTELLPPGRPSLVSAAWAAGQPAGPPAPPGLACLSAGHVARDPPAALLGQRAGSW